MFLLWIPSISAISMSFSLNRFSISLYIFDLSGYGDTPVSVVREDVIYVSGWSDRIFSILGALENGSTAIKEIEKIKL